MLLALGAGEEALLRELEKTRWSPGGWSGEGHSSTEIMLFLLQVVRV